MFGVVNLLIGGYNEMRVRYEEMPRIDSQKRDLPVFQKLSEWKEIDDASYEENRSEKEDNYC